MLYGFTQVEWNKVKEEARDLMVERAKVSEVISYSELVSRIKTVQLEAHDQRLFHLLGEVSSEEDSSGRGMLSVVVVHKSGDRQPGPGFFELAKTLGRDTSNEPECWINELKRVHAVWSNK